MDIRGELIMKKIRPLIIAAVAIVLILGLAACSKTKDSTGKASDTKKQTVKIAYLPLTHALPLYVEKEFDKKEFKNINIKLVKFGSWPELMDALNTGKVDGASVLIELAMKAKEQGIDLKAVALGHRDGNAVVVSKDINKTADLKGKTFAVPSKLSTHNILLYQMLKNAGLKLKDLNVLELPPPEMPAALSEGRLSGYIVAEPFGAKSVANGKGKVLYQSGDILKNSVCCGLVLRNSFIKKSSKAASELVEKYVKAGSYIDKNEEKVNETAKKYLNVEQNVLDLSLKWVSYKDLRLNGNDYDELSRYLKEMGLSKNPPAYKEFVDNTLIDKVN
jgi:NitT/TauT family transport system substrate-binding protein